MYFRTIRQRVDAPMENVLEGGHFFAVGFLWGGHNGDG